MRLALSAVTLSAIAITATGAAAQNRMPRECRQEIRQLCGNDRSAIRECLRESYRELSETCQGELRERMEARRGERSDRAGERGQRQAATRSQADFETISFGTHERQAIDFYAPTSADANGEKPPLILFVHGGGWTVGDRAQAVHAKPAYYTAKGYPFASTGYRLLPDSPVEDQARDVGAAVSAMRAQAGALGFDPDRIVLMGHSAGAHLAALVATDPQYTDDDFGAIAGVVLLDGAGYDVPANMAVSNGRSLDLYSNVFGDDVARQTALSPITHVGGPDAANWLVLHVAGRAKSTAQSRALAGALQDSGAHAEIVAVPDSSHSKLNQDLGKAGDMATARVDEFLAALPR